MKYLHPEVPGNESISFTAMLGQLTSRPLFSVFPFLEVAIAVYVWSELLYPSTNCNNITPLSSYYYPILMTLFDMSKFNVYVAGKHFTTGQYLTSIAACFDLNSFFFYMLLSIILSVHFVYSVVQLLFTSVYNWTLVVLNPNSEDDDMNKMDSLQPLL